MPEILAILMGVGVKSLTVFYYDLKACLHVYRCNPEESPGMENKATEKTANLIEKNHFVPLQKLCIK